MVPKLSFNLLPLVNQGWEGDLCKDKYVCTPKEVVPSSNYFGLSTTSHSATSPRLLWATYGHVTLKYEGSFWSDHLISHLAPSW